MDLEYEEEKINKQRMETFYIKEYINFFQEFHRLFKKGEIEDILSEQNLKNKKDNNESSPLNISSLSSELYKSPKLSPRVRSGILKKTIKKITISPKKNERDLNMENRLSIVRRIFDFHKEYPQGLSDLVKNILLVYNEFLMFSNSLRKQSEEISNNVYYLINNFYFTKT